jgi:hypothetical protein
MLELGKGAKIHPGQSDAPVNNHYQMVNLQPVNCGKRQYTLCFIDVYDGHNHCPEKFYINYNWYIDSDGPVRVRKRQSFPYA